MKKLALLLSILIAAAAALHAQTFNLQTNREPITSLDGLWRFHTGDNPAWASSNFDDSQWPLLRSDENWTRQGYPGYGGYAWYRFKLQLPDDNKPVSLLLTQIWCGYQVYADGKLIGSAGSATPTTSPVVNFVPSLYRLPSGTGPQTIQIAVRVWNFPPYASAFDTGGPQEPGNMVGDPELLQQRIQADRNASALTRVNVYAYCLITALVGLTVLVLFFLRSADREYLWFAAYVLAAGTNEVFAATFHLFASLPFSLTVLLDATTDASSVVAGLLFFSLVLRRRRSWLWWVACIAMALCPFGVILTWIQWTSWGVGHIVGAGLMLPAYFWIIVTLAVCAYRGDESARLLLAPAALLYGFQVLVHISEITGQLGWPAPLQSLFKPILLRPYPLLLNDIINYLFVLALLVFLVRRFSLARQEETRLSSEMGSARSIQSLLIPAIPPATPGFTVETVYFPASEVGGDFFQVLPADDGSLLIVVGDVSGKGLKAAMTVSAVIGALRNEPSRQPAQILNNLNHVLHGNISGFAVCTAALIASDGTLTIANAGNLAPYLNGEELPVDSGLPLGILADTAFAETAHHLNNGDRLTFVSDGVVEATNSQRELFGFNRTQAISTQPASKIAAAAQSFGQQDDISVLSITRTSMSEAAALSV